MTGADSGSGPPDDGPRGDPDDDWTQVAQRHFDPDEGRGLTVAVVRAIAEAEDAEMTGVTSPPLYEHIDAPALEDTLFGRNVADESRQGTDHVAFEYTDYLVRIRSDGWVQVYRGTDRQE